MSLSSVLNTFHFLKRTQDGVRLDRRASRQLQRKWSRTHSRLRPLHRPKTLEARLPDGTSRQLRGANVTIGAGTRAGLEPIPGLVEAQPLTHVEALELDEILEHLLVIGGGYVGLELSQAMRRFGSNRGCAPSRGLIRHLHGFDDLYGRTVCDRVRRVNNDGVVRR
jgi:pyruvate/2-oxoglutarate dehydrogenase complex dihydrolipoamide dehydrogenase (E3) component